MEGVPRLALNRIQSKRAVSSVVRGGAGDGPVVSDRTPRGESHKSSMPPTATLRDSGATPAGSLVSFGGEGDDDRGLSSRQSAGSPHSDTEDDAVSLLSASTGSTDRAFQAAKEALNKLRQDALATQEHKIELPKGEEVHITYPTDAGTVSTLCGGAAPGYKNGPASVALFNRPQGVAITPWTPRTVRYGVCGVVYVADTLNHCIRAVDKAGNVSTYAGDGKPGYVDGNTTVAKFNEPCGITVNSDGDIFVADRMNHCIRMIEMKTKKVSTFVGTPRAGFFDGGKIAAAFHSPRGLSCDRYNTLYVADFVNNRVRKITPDRRVVTLVGDGSFRHAVGRSVASKTAGPASVAADSWGNLYFTDQSHRVTKIADEQSVYTLAGSGSAGYNDGFGEFARFDYPSGVCVDHVGVIYVAEFGGNRIRMIESNGFVRTLAGSGARGRADGVGTAASFDRPAGIAVGPGFLLVADQYNHCIRRVTTLHKHPIPVPEAEPDTDVDSVNSLEDWYKVHRAEEMSFDSEDSGD